VTHVRINLLAVLFMIKDLISVSNLVGPAAFRPRAHTAASYTPLVEKGRPVLQGLLAIDFLAKEAS
jgi:exocyst complex component 4